MPSLYGTVQLGRMTLLDADFEAAVGGDGIVKLTVQASPTMLGGNAAVERRGQDLAGMDQQLIPVVFSDKAALSGFYRVAGVDLTHWSFPGIVGPRRVVATASLTLARAGYGNTVDIESRLTGTRTRGNDFAAVGEIWHAPPGGHSGARVATGPQPVPLVRASADGPITVYRGLATAAHPVWSSTVAKFGAGRARFLDPFGDERTGVGLPFTVGLTKAVYPRTSRYPRTGRYPRAGRPTGNVWTVSNGLLQVRPVDSGGTFTVGHWVAGQWREKVWDVRVDGGSVNPIDGFDVIHNSYDTVVLRLHTAQQPGLVTVDLTLRRGARFVEVFVASSYPATISLTRATAEAAIASTGYLSAAANDAAGDRYVVGAARAFTANPTTGGLSRPSARTLAGFVGAVVGGSAAQVGDTAAALFAQYLGTPTEAMTAVRR